MLKFYFEKVGCKLVLSFVCADYQNEGELGEALAEAFKAGLVKREDFFIARKLWNSYHGYVVEACKASLKKLQLDYLDLFLVHFIIATKHTFGTAASALDEDGVLDIDTTILLETTWHAMEQMVSMGLVHSIGIRLVIIAFFLSFITWFISYSYNEEYCFSKICINYDIFLTRDCLAYSKIKPAINQILVLVCMWFLQPQWLLIRFLTHYFFTNLLHNTHLINY
ncbi:putative mannose-6-phosphate 6-reductase [Helianthus anomalus]